jgi:hypothetical protein
MSDDIAMKKLWNDIECEETVSRLHSDEINPFKGIDARAARIREAITNFEAEDQELFLCHIDLGGNDSVVDRLNQRGLPLKAREGLFTLIMERTDRTDEQERAVDSLRCWFHELEKVNEIPNPTHQFPMNNRWNLSCWCCAILNDIKKKEQNARRTSTKTELERSCVKSKKFTNLRKNAKMNFQRCNPRGRLTGILDAASLSLAPFSKVTMLFCISN